MPTTTFSSREFTRNASEVTKAADQGPVFITERGRAAYVLLKIEDYRTLTAPHQKIAELLAMPDVGEFELSIPPSRDRPTVTELD